MTIRVLLADDHAIVRDGLRRFLELQEGIEVVGEAASGTEALERCAETRPDVVVMDLAMPGIDGIEATRRLKAALPATKVLVLTSFADDDRLFPALEAGANGYLTKDVEPARLAAAIATVAAGDPLLHPDVTRRLMARAAGARRRPEGTVTILFTDIEGSTQLVSALGDERSRAVMRAHDEALRAALREAGGIEVKHVGDGLMAAFSSARRAVGCAVAMQRSIAAAPPGGVAIRIRAGLNTGDVIAEDHDYFGECVVKAARIAAAARGGEILVSEVTRTLAGDGARFVERGSRELKGLRGEHRVFAVEWGEAS